MAARFKEHASPVLAVRWLARLWATALVFFWGAFFVEHTTEWFARPHDWPPLDVVLLHLTHFALLVGLIAGWRWELLGGILAFAAAILFFPQVAGKNAPLFLLVSVGPSVLWIGLAGYVIGRCASPAVTVPPRHG